VHGRRLERKARPQIKLSIDEANAHYTKIVKARNSAEEQEKERATGVKAKLARAKKTLAFERQGTNRLITMCQV